MLYASAASILTANIRHIRNSYKPTFRRIHARESNASKCGEDAPGNIHNGGPKNTYCKTRNGTDNFSTLNISHSTFSQLHNIKSKHKNCYESYLIWLSNHRRKGNHNVQSISKQLLINQSCSIKYPACQKRSVHTLSAEYPKVNALEMKRELKQKGMPVADSYTALTVECVMCEGKERGTMHINKTTGYFSCATCEARGEWTLLQRALRFGTADEKLLEEITRARADTEQVRGRWTQIKDETDALGDLDDAVVERLFALFEWPYHKESAKVLSEARVERCGSALVLPLRGRTGRVVGYRRLRADGPTDSAGEGGLFVCRAVRATRADQAVLVPELSDVLHLARDRVPGLLVWWYNGLLPPAALPTLEAFKKVVVWGGADNIRGVGDKLNQDRCRFVRAINGATTATEAAAGCSAGALRAAVSEASPAAHRAITTFRALRDEVYANVTNAEKVRGVKWTRFPSLTSLLGGHRRGELTVLTGATGCGKTTLAAEMSLDLAASGVNTLWGSFEIRNSRLAQTMLQQHAGVPLEQHLDQFQTYADQFQRLPIYFLAFHGPQPIPLVMEAVEHARYVHDIAHVIVDNVQFMLGVGDAGGAGERYFRQDAVIAAFRAFATRRDCHVTLVMHPRKERDAEDLSTSSIFGSAKASQEADNVLIIQDKRLTAVRGKKYLQVAKNRFSGDLGIVPLEFDKAALSYRAKKRTRDKKDEQRDDTQDGGHTYGKQDGRHREDKQDGGHRKEESFLSEMLDLDKDR